MNSICRIWPTATSVVTRARRALGIGAAIGARHLNLVAVQVDGWLVMVRLPTRMRTSFSCATTGLMAGEDAAVPAPDVEVQSWC